MFCCLFEAVSAFRTVFEVFICRIAAMAADLRTASFVDQGQIFRTDDDALPILNGHADFIIELIQGVAAAGLHVIAVVPAEERDEEKVEDRADQKDVVASIGAAGFTGHQALFVFKLFLFVIDPDRKKHI